MNDSTILKDADQIVSIDRQKVYGSPADDFTRSTDMLTALGFRFETHEGQVGPLKAEHVPMIMTVVKLARLANNKNMFHRDSWLDIAGYAKTADMVNLDLYTAVQKCSEPAYISPGERPKQSRQ